MIPRRFLALIIAGVLLSACASSVAIELSEADQGEPETLAAASDGAVPASASPTAAATVPAAQTRDADAETTPSCTPGDGDATFVMLAPEGSTSSEVWDLNDHGLAVGSFRRPADSVVARGAIWQPDGSVEELSLGDVTLLYGINNDGVIVGRDNVGQGTRSFVIEPGSEPEWFEVDKSTATFVDDINDVGQAVGAYFYAGHRSVGGFIRQPSGQITTFATPGAMDPGLEINNHGEVAGTYRLDGVAYVYVRSSEGQVETFQVSEGAQPDGLYVRGHSDSGEIVGYQDFERSNIGFRRSSNGVIEQFDVGDGGSTFKASAINGANIAGVAGDTGIVVLGDQTTLRFASPDGPLSILAINDSLTVAGVHRSSGGFQAFTWSPGACSE